MNNNMNFGFVGGFLLGGIVGATITLLMAPASGAETRQEIRSEGAALKRRSHALGGGTLRRAKRIVKQSQKSAADAQARVSEAAQDQTANVREALDAFNS